MPKLSFFNTTSLSGSELKESIAAAKTQDSLIMALFNKTNGEYSPSQVWKLCDPQGVSPVTSYRRSITTLTKKGLLVQTGFYIAGIFGKKEGTWKLKNKK